MDYPALVRRGAQATTELINVEQAATAQCPLRPADSGSGGDLRRGDRVAGSCAFPAVRQVVFVEALPGAKRAEIEAVLPAALRGNFFSLNLETVRAAMETLPGCVGSKVQRVWPGKAGTAGRGAQTGGALGRRPGRAGEQPWRSLCSRLPGDAAPQITGCSSGRRGHGRGGFTSLWQFAGAFLPLGQQPVAVTLSPRLAWR